MSNRNSSLPPKYGIILSLESYKIVYFSHLLPRYVIYKTIQMNRVTLVMSSYSFVLQN